MATTFILLEETPIPCFSVIVTRIVLFLGKFILRHYSRLSGRCFSIHSYAQALKFPSCLTRQNEHSTAGIEKASNFKLRLNYGELNLHQTCYCDKYY